MKNNVYVDIHVLQTVPPSCVNRDDTGSPKTAFYGGVTRARVSSQSWKKAVRDYFKANFSEENESVRTKHVTDYIAGYMDLPEEKAKELAQKVMEAAKVTVGKDGKTDALFFLSAAQAKALASIAEANTNGKFDKKECQEALKKDPAIDIALFGRMVADDPSLNFDAAAQVAHAISTHAVKNEYDYFTAVDDCSPEDTAGAGHLGMIEYNSSTLYRYATVNARELEEHLKTDTAHAVRKFVKAFICSMPTGKQNTFANRTRPDAVYVTIRSDQPVNMAGAFERPVYAEKGGYAEPSAAAFIKYAKESYQDFVDAPKTALAVGSCLAPLADAMPLSEMLETLEKKIGEALAGGSR